MERIKRARKPERTAVSKAIAVIEAEIIKETVNRLEVDILLESLDRHLQKLQDLDEKLKNALLDNEEITEEQLQTECDAIEEYQMKATSIKFRANSIFAHMNTTNSTPHDLLSAPSELSQSSPSSQSRTTIKLPRIELKRYSGELSEWLGWWAQFEKIHEDETLHESDKFTYLVQSMIVGSRAHDLVTSYPQSKENYLKVVKALTERYGNRKLLKQVYVRELIQMIVQNRSKEKSTLENLYDRLESHLRSLETLGVSGDQMVVFLFPMIESSLSEDILLAWQRSPYFGKDGSSEDPPMSELDYLMYFLKQEIDNEEQRKLARNGFGTVGEKKKFIKRKDLQEDDLPTSAGLFSGNSTKVNCLFCDRSHESKDCYKAQKMSMDERREKVQKKGACFSCFRTGHISKKCRSLVKCPVCSRKHQVLFCPDIQALGRPQSSLKKSDGNNTIQTNLNCTNEVILRTLRVVIANPMTNCKRTVRILLDCGSQRSYILKKTAKEIGLVAESSITVNHTLFGGSEVKDELHAVHKLEVCSLTNRFSLQMTVLDQKEICGFVPRLQVGPWMSTLKRRGIELSDVDPKNALKIEMLVGADYIGQLLTGRIIQLDDGLTATETRLGWTVMGSMQCSRKEANVAMAVISMTLTSASITELWSLETLGIRDPVEIKSKEERERAAHTKFLETVTRLPNGRYSVSLPWVNEQMSLPDNYNVARRRLDSTRKKLSMIGKYSQYEDVFKSWEAEGIVSQVDSPVSIGLGKFHYLPHRAVLKMESKTTPIRPVYDASCKQGRVPSLNDCLEKGPNLLELIPSLLLRFRMGNLGVTADIRKAFLMIEVHEADRDFLRFLWWNDARKTITVYRHNRVVFGMNCSPYLLGAVINHHLSQYQDRNPEIVSKLKDSLYVDNCVLSVDSIEDFETFKSSATETMADAQMELRQWERSGDRETGDPSGVLGLKWNKMADTICCAAVSKELPSVVTKRVILSSLQQIYDPLGFLSPVLLLPKILLQKAWLDNRNWDQELDKDTIREFIQWWTGMLTLLKEFQLPRNCTGGAKVNPRNSQLHVFADASKSAYSTVIFLRVETTVGVSVRLIQSKARVAPVKSVTTPRLELLACCIAARLVSSVRKALNFDKIPIWLWSDSSTTLSWIKRSDEWGTFVGNRVREILKLTDTERWKFVPGHLNPADLPSRGIQPCKFTQLRWADGPEWLKLESNQWPSFEYQTDEDEINREKKLKSVSLTVKSDACPWYVIRNDYSINLRILAYVFRALDTMRQKQHQISSTLTAGELDRAECRLLKLVQKESFQLESGTIHGIVVQKEDGLFKVKTKLTHSTETSWFKSPVLLPNSHRVVELLVRDAHIFNCHAGVQTLMGILREKFWIVGGRKTVKKIIRACTVCQRFTSKKAEVPVSALPEDRIKRVGAFEVVGIDLAGPLVLRDNSKVWIVLFTCGVYRCVHLELVQSLSTEDFLLAFIRFCSRKRRPAVIYTDNGTNFRGAVNLFRSIDWKLVEKRTQQKRIQWKFIPPTAPWWGGWWERLIRSVKDLLKRMLGFGKLTHTQLETCLCEVEAVINHRPLTFVTEDDQDLVPLTPAMFIYDLPHSEIPETKLLKVLSLQTTKKRMDCLMVELRDRFRKEYLGQLIQRGKEKKRTHFKIGDLVFVARDDKKRIFWPLAKIVELIPGKDGENRVAKVKTKEGEFTRPIQRLYHLEVSHDESLFPALLKKRSEVSDDQPTKEVKTRSGRSIRRPQKYLQDYI